MEKEIIETLNKKIIEREFKRLNEKIEDLENILYDLAYSKTNNTQQELKILLEKHKEKEKIRIMKNVKL